MELKENLSELDKCMALTAFWLEEPSTEIDELLKQTAKGMWLEDRYFQNWIEILKKLFG